MWLCAITGILIMLSAPAKVEYLLFGFLPGHVGLRGRLHEEGGGRDTVKVCAYT